MKILTSFMKLSTGEGNRIAFTFSEVNEDTGQIISQNNKGNFLIMNEEVQQQVENIEKYIKENFLR